MSKDELKTEILDLIFKDGVGVNLELMFNNVTTSHIRISFTMGDSNELTTAKLRRIEKAINGEIQTAVENSEYFADDDSLRQYEILAVSYNYLISDKDLKVIAKNLDYGFIHILDPMEETFVVHYFQDDKVTQTLEFRAVSYNRYKN